MTKDTKSLIIIGAGMLVAGGVAYYFTKPPVVVTAPAPVHAPTPSKAERIITTIGQTSGQLGSLATTLGGIKW